MPGASRIYGEDLKKESNAMNGKAKLSVNWIRAVKVVLGTAGTLAALGLAIALIFPRGEAAVSRGDATLLTGDSAAALPGDSAPRPPATAPTNPPITTAPRAPTASKMQKADELWKTASNLDSSCRGGPSPVDHPEIERICKQRDDALKASFFASNEALYEAWVQRDLEGMRRLAHPSNRDWPGRLIPEDLVKFTPSEGKFGDCTYDVVNSGEAGCYMKMQETGKSFYFHWELSFDRGWLVTGFVPDV